MRAEGQARSSCLLHLSWVPAGGAHLVPDKRHAECITDGASSEIDTGLPTDLSHRCFAFWFLASEATALPCRGITSRCSAQERAPDTPLRTDRHSAAAWATPQQYGLVQGLPCHLAC